MHDFGCKNQSFLSREDCAEALSLNLADSLAKYNHLGRKTDSILHSSVHVGLIYEGVLAGDMILKLDDVLTWRYKKKIQIFNVLNINEQAPSIDKENVHFLVVDESNSPKNGTSKQWQGNDASWIEALSKINLRDVVID